MVFDDTDRKLLKIIQGKLPIVPEPYREIGEELGISEAEVIARLKVMVDNGIIRRLGGVFDSRKLGYSSVLCALEVPGERIDEVAEVINSFNGVTHNYLREDTINMWFTLLAPSGEKLAETLQIIRERTGIQEILTFPAEKIYKIRVNFELD
jgi:DNA-binding Lrp family transcriptional regulator